MGNKVAHAAKCDISFQLYFTSKPFKAENMLVIKLIVFTLKFMLRQFRWSVTSAGRLNHTTILYSLTMGHFSFSFQKFFNLKYNYHKTLQDNTIV